MGNNEEEISKLDKEIKMLEKKLGIKNDAKRKKRLYKEAEVEGLGKGFMDFLDNVTSKVKMDNKKYKPEEYEFSEGEGMEEEQLQMNEESDSDQEGFNEFGEEVQAK